MIRLPRHLEECGAVAGHRVALLRSPALPFDRDVAELLLRCTQQIVQAIGLRPGVGEAPAAVHHGVEVVAVLGGERNQQSDDCVPRVGSARTDDVAGHFALEPDGARLVHRRDVGRHRLGVPPRVDIHRISFTHRVVTIRRLVITLRGWFEDAGIEHTHVAGKSGDDEGLVEAGHRPCGHRVPALHQYLDPFAEAIGVELLVASRPRVTP